MRSAVFLADIPHRRAAWRTFLFKLIPKPARYQGLSRPAANVRTATMFRPVICDRDQLLPSQYGSPRAVLPAARDSRGLLHRHVRPGLTALCIGFALMGSTAFAAGDGSGQQRDYLNVRADPELTSLLRKVEQQVSDGHAMSPVDDNAMDTWQRVLELRRVDPEAPHVLSALTDFASYMRGRAADERIAGRLVVASDLTVFADQASRLLGRTGAGPVLSSDTSRTTTPRPGPDAPTSRVAAAAPPGGIRRDIPAVDASSAPVISLAQKPAVTDQRVTVIAPAQTKVPPGAQILPNTSTVAGGAPTAMAPLPQIAASGPVSILSVSGPEVAPAPRETRVALADKAPVAGPIPASAPAVPAPLPQPAAPGPVSVSGAAPASTPRNTRVALADKPPVAALIPATAPASAAAAVPAPAPVEAAKPATPAVALAEPVPVRPPDAASLAPSATSMSPEAVTVLLRCGDALLQQNDVVAARLFYERAAAAGSGEGATSAGKTYDPNFLSTVDAPGLKSDVARAIYWYRVASTVHGDKEAGDRLKVLIAQSGR